MQDNYTPYCKVCSSCGENGCCSPLLCAYNNMVINSNPECKYGYQHFKDIELTSDLLDEFDKEIWKIDQAKSRFDRIYNKVYAPNKQLVIMRGVPGSGKSTYAKKEYFSYEILSTDDYFIKDGVYQFNKDDIGKAHQWNKDRCAAAMGLDCHIVIDNTNTRFWEFQWYIDMGIYNDYDINIVSFIPSIDNLDLYSSRNIHKVPKDIIEIMINRFQRIDKLMGVDSIVNYS